MEGLYRTLIWLLRLKFRYSLSFEFRIQTPWILWLVVHDKVSTLSKSSEINNTPHAWKQKNYFEQIVQQNTSIITIKFFAPEFRIAGLANRNSTVNHISGKNIQEKTYSWYPNSYLSRSINFYLEEAVVGIKFFNLSIFRRINFLVANYRTLTWLT